MYVLAFATDYDGTLADHGTVTDAAYAAMERLRKTGRKLLLVTGRDLEDLKDVFPGLDVFDKVVAENGALLYTPASREARVLSPPPSEALIARLAREGVTPLHVGRSVVATEEPYEINAIEAIKELGLELEIIFNKGAVMILPTGVNKATGLAAALEELQFSMHNVVAIGDAQNDHALLRAVGFGVAVDNALPELKQTADVVTKGARGAGVIELADKVIKLDGRLFRTERQLVPVGKEKKDGKPVHITPYGGGVLIAGTSGTGKSTFATALLEAFAEREFQFCVLDPEGDYEELGGAVMVGGADRPPNERQIFDLLEKPTNSVVVNMLGLKTEERPDFFAKLLPELISFRARTGRPHWLLIDEAHHLMPAARDGESLTLPRSLAGTVMITVHPDLLSPGALEAVETVIGLGPKAHEMIAAVCKVLGIKEPDKNKPLKKKKKGLFWDRSEKGTVLKIDVAEPEQRLKRHRRKYAEGDLGDNSFYFRGPKGELNLKAQNLMMFVQIAEGIDDRTWEHHLRAGDYSDWFRRCIKDDDLADMAESVESEAGRDAGQARAQIIEAVRSRYTVPAE
jgi:hydroxymethylpyrimidine pyrophosphatase-like HAD family hydrolase